MNRTALSLSAALLATSATAHAGERLDAIKERGNLICGVSQPSAGWASPDDSGRMVGMDADVCRAMAAALFGDAEKVEFLPLNFQVRFQALQSGEIDVLSRQTTNTYSREISLGANFGPTIFYDGQGLMVNADLGVESALELDGASICILPGTTSEKNVSDYFRANNMSFEPVVFESGDEWRSAFFSGRCDVATSDRSDLASARAVANDPSQFVILPETISKEPLGPSVPQGDDDWWGIMSWVVYALFFAEERGITSQNVDEFLESEDPEIQRFLGVTEGLGSMAGLDDKWAYNAIKQVGNYEELFERHLGPDTPLGLSRGLNKPWTEGGLLYAPPFR